MNRRIHRAQELIDHLGSGKTTAETATEMNLSARTVENYIARIARQHETIHPPKATLVLIAYGVDPGHPPQNGTP